jgi:hypothetical protein
VLKAGRPSCSRSTRWPRDQRLLCPRSVLVRRMRRPIVPISALTGDGVDLLLEGPRAHPRGRRSIADQIPTSPSASSRGDHPREDLPVHREIPTPAPSRRGLEGPAGKRTTISAVIHVEKDREGHRDQEGREAEGSAPARLDWRPSSTARCTCALGQVDRTGPDERRCGTWVRIELGRGRAAPT